MLKVDTIDCGFTCEFLAIGVRHRVEESSAASPAMGRHLVKARGCKKFGLVAGPVARSMGEFWARELQ